MRIHSLELRNIKSYDHLQVDFTDGVNGIVGHNGAGKSTIVEAIGFALFDAIDYTQAGFLRQDTNEGEVVVTFESALDKRTYQAIRKIGPGGGQAIHDPELAVDLCTGSADVPRFLRLHLGLSPETEMAQLFKDAVGVPQGALAAIFSISATFRKRAFDPLLRVEEYQRAFEKLLEAKNLLLKRIGDLDVEIARLKGVLEQMPLLRERARTNAGTLTTTIAELARGRTALGDAETERVRLETQRAALQQAEQQRDAARAELATAQARLDLAQRLLAETEQAQAIVAAHRAGHDRYLEAQQTRSKLDARLHERQRLELQRAQSAGRADEANREVQKTEPELADAIKAEARLKALRPKVAEQEKLEQRRLDLQSRAAGLESALRELAQHTSQHRQESERLAKDQAKLRELPQIEAQIAAVEREVKTLRVDKDRLQETKTEVTAKGMHYREHGVEIDKLTGEEFCPICEQPIRPGHLDHLKQRNEQERAALREQLRTVNARLAELQKRIDDDEVKGKELLKLRSQIPDPKGVAQLEQQVAALNAMRAAAAEQIKTLSGAKEELERVEADLAALGNPRLEMERVAIVADRRAALQQILERAQAASSEAQEKLAELEKALLPYATLEDEQQTLAQTLTEHLAAYQAVLANEQIAAARERRAADTTTAQGAANTAQERLSATESAVAEAAARFDAVAYQALATEGSRLRGLVGGLERQQQILEEERTKLTADIAALGAQETELAEARQRRAKLDTQEKVLDKMRRVIKDSGPYITKELIGRTSEQAARIFGELTGDFSRRLCWNEDYGITLEVDGRERDFKNLSGGEQMVAALSVRLALLREMSTIDIAFFDEPTAHLDDQRREALASQILAIKGFRQIFVISHDDTFERATHNLIHVERVDGVSRLIAA